MTCILFAWALLLVLLALQVFAELAHAGWASEALAVPMIGLVAFLFMGIGRASALSRIFALAGLLWLAVLIALTSVDFLARHDEAAPVTTRP